MDERGSIEILLLLCCLVGVVAFICFAMGALNMSEMVTQNAPPDRSELTQELDHLKTAQVEKEEERMRLKNRAAELEKRIREKEKELAQMKSRDEAVRQNQEEDLRALQKEAEALEKLLRQKEQELSAMRPQDDEAERKRLEAERDRLKSQLEELEQNIKAKAQGLAKMKPRIPEESTLAPEVERLRKEIEAANQRMEALQKEIAEKKEIADTFNPWRDFQGADRLKNPLFVECKLDTIVLHPQKKVWGLSEFRKDNPFLAASQGYDGIIFLVRPDGFETFNQALAQAKKTHKKMGYEPVDARWRLDFSERRGK